MAVSFQPIVHVTVSDKLWGSFYWRWLALVLLSDHIRKSTGGTNNINNDSHNQKSYKFCGLKTMLDIVSFILDEMKKKRVDASKQLKD